MSDDKTMKDNDKQAPITGHSSLVTDEMLELKNKCEEYLNGWKRAQADYQNLVKENAKQRSELIRYANEDLILDLLPILDNFKIAYSQIPEDEKSSSWVVGFSHIKKQLEDVLAASGIEPIKTVGEKFDVSCHEAIDKRTDGKKEDDVVLEEVQPGYRLNGKVIQVAKVIINHIEK